MANEEKFGGPLHSIFRLAGLSKWKPAERHGSDGR
jgi:hypothetical protein